MLHKPGVTEGLAQHVVATRWEDIPLQVRHQAKRSLINFFAVTLAGCRSGPVEIALRLLAEFSGGRQVTVIGRTERLDALSAAFLNAACANVDDFCDTHAATVIHPTAPVAAALLACAEWRQASGPDLFHHSALQETGDLYRNVVLDTTKDEVVASIAVGKRPWGIAISPDGG